MALFKISRGDSTKLPKERHDGWAYFTTDTHEFFIDYADRNGVIQRGNITTPRTTPRLSEDGVYYFDTTAITPIIPTVLANCGGAEEISNYILYNTGASADEFGYEEIWKL